MCQQKRAVSGLTQYLAVTAQERGSPTTANPCRTDYPSPAFHENRNSFRDTRLIRARRLCAGAAMRARATTGRTLRRMRLQTGTSRIARWVTRRCARISKQFVSNIAGVGAAPIMTIGMLDWVAKTGMHQLGRPGRNSYQCRLLRLFQQLTILQVLTLCSSSRKQSLA